MTDDSPHPWVWWVRVRDVLGGPTAFTMYGDGALWAWWADGYFAPMRDADMRRYGYERCYCSPLDGFTPTGDCPAHGREYQPCAAGMGW